MSQRGLPSGTLTFLFTELFTARAGIEDPLPAELCQRLDSLPLAVELAAARARAPSPAQMLERLPRRMAAAVERDHRSRPGP